MNKNTDKRIPYMFVIDPTVPKVDDQGKEAFMVTESKLGRLFKVHPHLKQDFLSLVNSMGGRPMELTKDYKRILRRDDRKRHKRKV